MIKYKYSEKFIEELNLKQLENEYSLSNKNYNLAIYYALSAVEQHYKEIVTNKISTIPLLMGDYYSFEYYYLLKDDLQKLDELTTVMKEGYKSLINNGNVVDFFESIIKVLFNFYNKIIKKEDAEKLLQKFKKYFNLRKI